MKNKIDLVCIVDDDPTHVFITKKYIELSGFVDKILVCSNINFVKSILCKITCNTL